MNSTPRIKSAAPNAAGKERVTERSGVQSVARAFAILREIARSREGISLAELSKKVQLHNSTTFHLVRTMTALGYIRQTKSNKQYCIGTELFGLAAGAVDEIELTRLASPILEELAAQTGECAHLAVLLDDNIVTLARAAAAGALQVADNIGIVRPVHATALGKVLLSQMESAPLQALLHRHELQRFTPKTIVEPELLMQEIEQARQTGIAYDEREYDSEMRCTAAGVLDSAGNVVAAIGISGPIWRLPIQSLHEKSLQVKKAAEQLSTLLRTKSVV